MHTMSSRTATYTENPHHTRRVKQGFPVGPCKAERCQCVVRVTNANKRGRSFLKWWKLSFVFLVQRSLLCFKQTDFGAENNTQDFPSLSLTWDIFCGTFQRHAKTGLECPWAKDKKIRGTLPILFRKTPTPAKMFCAAPSPLGTLRAHLAVKTLAITKHLMCTRSLARNLQPCSWIF